MKTLILCLIKTNGKDLNLRKLFNSTENTFKCLIYYYYFFITGA
jgi:hypothetical protein